MSSDTKEDLQRKVEEVKQDVDVQRALQQASATKKSAAPVARGRDKFFIITHFIFLLGLGALYQLVKARLPWLVYNYPVVLKFILAAGVVVVCLMILRLTDVYFIGRVKNAVYRWAVSTRNRTA